MFELEQCSGALKEFCERNEELHSAIIAENIDKINEILEANEHRHSFYNSKNESAAKTALSNKLLMIYEILLKNKVFLGRNEILYELWSSFNEDERIILKEIHFEYSVHMPEKHLHDLTNSSSLSHDDPDTESKFNHIKNAFSILNENPFLRLILMISAATKSLNIIFDFKSTSVIVIDPTANFGTQGLYYLKGRIYIAASFLLDQRVRYETLGTMAHELCHYTMNLVYKNMAKPYKKNDRERRREFAEISKICEKNKGLEKIIELVYNYPRNVQHAELVVRVPHLMAMYYNQPEKMMEVRQNFNRLFDYFEKKVVPDMKEALPKVEKEIENMERKILINKIIAIVTAIFAIILLIAGFFIMRSIFYKPTLKFNELPENDQIAVKNSIISYKNEEIMFKELFAKGSIAYEKLSSEHISIMLNNEVLNFSDSHLYYLDKLVTHKWENLTLKLKNKFLSSNFKFQNQSLIYRNISSLEAFDDLTSQQILNVFDGINFKIDKMISNRSEIYIDRNFWVENIYEIFFKYTKDAKSELRHSEENFIMFYEKFLSSNSVEYFNKIRGILNEDDYQNTIKKKNR